MTNLKYYFNDGANYQAQAVLCFLKPLYIEESFNDKLNDYMANPQVARWENCREQGYVITMRSSNFQKQINIAFFEHRNSDSIHAIRWEETTLNSPNIDTANFGDIYKNKWNTSFSVNYGEIVKMADWIKKELTKFWERTSLKNS